MQHKSVAFKADDIEGRTFKGYASTYDKDLGGDVIAPGAFAKTLAERGARVKVLWQHSEPIGRPVDMREDGKGLYVEAKISNTRLGDEALELMRDGVIDQMSIGYSVPQGKSEYQEDGTRLIKELKLYEFSAVTFPMNEAAIITGVKSLSYKEIERVLREAGLSRSQAKAIASGGVGNLREAEEHAQKHDQFRESLTALLNDFKL